MYTVDEIVMAAPAEICFRTAADVERWPELLSHYRWVRFQRKDDFATGRVEMAARREFGAIPYPVWWVSEMTIDETRPAVLYRHVDGVTTGMDVVWSFEALADAETLVRIEHIWDGGPRWPVPRWVRREIARRIIGPVFIQNVAGRTLEGIRTRAERLHSTSGSPTS